MSELLQEFFGGMFGVLGMGAGLIVLVIIGCLAYKRFIGDPIGRITGAPGRVLRSAASLPGNFKSIIPFGRRKKTDVAASKAEIPQVITKIPDEVPENVSASKISRIKKRLPSRPEWTKWKKKKVEK